MHRKEKLSKKNKSPTLVFGTLKYGRAFPCPFNEFCCFLLGHLSRQKNLRTETTTWAHCCLKKYLILWRSAKNCWDFFPVPWNLRFSMIGFSINTQYPQNGICSKKYYFWSKMMVVSALDNLCYWKIVSRMVEFQIKFFYTTMVILDTYSILRVKMMYVILCVNNFNMISQSMI